MKDNSNSNLMEKIVALCKRRGFIYPGSEIYGGLSGTWDLGPLGVLLANNVKNEWRKSVIYSKDNVVEIDSSILLNSKVWEASGHIASFTDPLVECQNCHWRYRTDTLINPSDYPTVIREFVTASDKALDDITISNQKVDNLLKAYDKILSGRSWGDLNDLEKRTLNVMLDFMKKELEENEKRLGLRKLVTSELQSFKKFYGFFTWVILNRTARCPNCAQIKWVAPREFNLMFKTYIGPVDSQENLTFLRPETAQGIFINYKNVLDSTRIKIPFGIAQIGKGFRNEITIGNFLFRVREFEMMELEYFIEPSEAEKTYEKLIQERLKWYLDLGIKKDNLKQEVLKKEDLAHYSKGTTEIWYNWPFMGFGELEGIANRGDHDLHAHQDASGIDLSYFEEPTKKKYLPFVIEPSVGVGRAMLAFLLDSYHEDGDRIVLKLNPKLAPYKVAVFPLLANKEDLVGEAKKIYEDLRQDMMVAWDDRGNIGKRYFAQDEAGTPFCVTVDFQSLEDKTVTVRERDTAVQERIAIDKLSTYFAEKLK